MRKRFPLRPRRSAFHHPLLAVLACLLPLTIASAPAGAAAAEARPSRAEFLFMAANPCPATGQTHGRCKGYVIDRVIPIVCGGEDAPDNMQWLTIAEAKAKAKWDRIGCRRGRKAVYPQLQDTPAAEVFPAELPSGAIKAETLPLR